ncbi:hypothetical protein ACSVC9_00910 [Clostridium sp. LBM24168]
MKKFLCILTSVSLMGGILWYNYNLNRCKDFNYALNRYLTTGIFNKYKLYSIDDAKLYFSNGQVSFFKVDGISAKYPHEKINYRVSMQKNSHGIWKIGKIYFDEKDQNQ